MNTPDLEEHPGGPRSTRALAALVGVALCIGIGLLALGRWQLQRLAWKEDLLARIGQQTQAVATALPGPRAWGRLTAADLEYRRVEVRGVYEPGTDTLVQAVTEFGAGHWVLTALRHPEGFQVFVNRGFVPLDVPRPVPAAPAGVQVLEGLVRLSEPGGTLLQDNDAAHGRWYSRDVAAIAGARHLSGPVAPYFVDASAAPADGRGSTWPRAGLTVLRFSNNHRVYALTWFALAAMVFCAVGYVVVDERRLRRLAGDTRLAQPRHRPAS